MYLGSHKRNLTYCTFILGLILAAYQSCQTRPPHPASGKEGTEVAHGGEDPSAETAVPLTLPSTLRAPRPAISSKSIPAAILTTNSRIRSRKTYTSLKRYWTSRCVWQTPWRKSTPRSIPTDCRPSRYRIYATTTMSSNATSTRQTIELPSWRREMVTSAPKAMLIRIFMSLHHLRGPTRAGFTELFPQRSA